MITKKIIVGKHTNYPLDGCLTLPDNTDAPVPAVVFVHGSGSSNMDEKVGKLTPFKDLAEGLAKHGIASIRYDKRSFTYSLKMLKDKNLTITVKEETIEDAILATELLRNDARIDSDKIFIIGHSMGGMLAPRIDAEGGNYKGLIIMSGTPRKLEEVMLDQNDVAMESLNPLLKKLALKQVEQLKYTFEHLYDISDEDAKRRKFAGGTTLYYFKEMGDHASPKYLNNINKPMLIMQGEKDFQADKDKDFGAYKALLCDRSNVTFKLYKNLNHAFVPAMYDSISKAKKEFNKERHIGEEVIADIANWIKSV